MNNVVLVLKRARERIQKGWVQGDFARSSRGFPCASYEDEAICWCLTGALGADELTFRSSEGYRAARLAVKDCLPAGFGFSIVNFNDDDATTQADVLAVIDRAIANLERSTA